MNTEDNTHWEAKEAKEAHTMAVLAKPFNQAIVIKKGMQHRFAHDSRKSAPSAERINQLKAYSKMIPFKKDGK